MSWSGTRRSSILKRRNSGADRLIVFIKRFGLWCLILLAASACGIWFVTSGAYARSLHNLHNAILEETAERGFAVQNILVDGRHHTDADTIKAMVNMRGGDPIFAFDPAAARTLIEKLSWVKSAHVERRLPDTIYIKLEERTPIALFQKNRKLYLIDADGVTLTDEGLENFRDMLIVLGEGAPKAAAGLLTMLKAEPLIEERVESATLMGGRRWDLRLKSGADVKLPEKDLGLALRRLAVNHEEDAILDKDVLSIDVREEARITVRTKPGAAQDYDANSKAGSRKTTPAAGSPI